MANLNDRKVIFSGIQPTNIIHIGNYLGALKSWVGLQDKNETIFCVVDLHAITVPQDPETLRKKTLETAALFIACGVDPEKSSIFVQSSRAEHSELAWILNCFTYTGELRRMTQFKDKSGESQDSVSAGLFDYPVLMAADILLYQATHVPVGEDQKQHIEITRDIAQRLNNKYGELFTIPEPIIQGNGARIMALDDASKKMSKSSPNPASFIALTDSPDTIREKVKRATTDSGSGVKAGADKPEITNLLNIFSAITGREIAEIEQEFAGKGYGEFKSALAEAIVSELAPIQEKFNSLMQNPDELKRILEAGSQKVAKEAGETLARVKEKIGLI